MGETALKKRGGKSFKARVAVSCVEPARDSQVRPFAAAFPASLASAALASWAEFVPAAAVAAVALEEAVLPYPADRHRHC